jgi:hypothetical protein
MRLFSKLFRRSPKKVNILAPLDSAKGTYVVTQSFKVKFRPAQNLPPALRDNLLDICHRQHAVSACYLLDVLESGTGKVKFLVNLLIDEPEVNMPLVAPMFTQAFKPYPEIVERGFVGANILEVPLDGADYRRPS